MAFYHQFYCNEYAESATFVHIVVESYFQNRASVFKNPFRIVIDVERSLLIRELISNFENIHDTLRHAKVAFGTGNQWDTFRHMPICMSLHLHIACYFFLAGHLSLRVIFNSSCLFESYFRNRESVFESKFEMGNRFLKAIFKSENLFLRAILTQSYIFESFLC